MDFKSAELVTTDISQDNLKKVIAELSHKKINRTNIVSMISFEQQIKKYIDPDQNDLQKILDYFEEKEIKKGQFFVRSGQTSNEFAFILQGCLRVYWKRDKTEVTGWFAFENEFFCELSSFIPQQPSFFGVQAIENTTILYITRRKMEKLFNEVPLFETFVRRFWEEIISHFVSSTVSFQTETAEKRYQKAIKHPKLLQRVPLKYLSSFLGLTPSSLSRLRKQK